MERFKIEDLDNAIKKAWELQKNIYLYPKEMNLILVDDDHEENDYLSNTTIIDATCFDTIEEFVDLVKKYADIYNLTEISDIKNLKKYTLSDDDIKIIKDALIIQKEIHYNLLKDERLSQDAKLIIEEKIQKIEALIDM